MLLGLQYMENRKKGFGPDRDVTAHLYKSSTARTNHGTRIRADTPLRSRSGRCPVSESQSRGLAPSRDQVGAFQTQILYSASYLLVSRFCNTDSPGLECVRRRYSRSWLLLAATSLSQVLNHPAQIGSRRNSWS